MNLVNQIKNAKSISVDMFNNKLTLDGTTIQTPKISFSCNWCDQEILDIIDVIHLNADHHNISIKDTEKGKVNLPLYTAVLIKTNLHDCVSIGYYSC